MSCLLVIGEFLEDSGALFDLTVIEVEGRQSHAGGRVSRVIRVVFDKVFEGLDRVFSEAVLPLLFGEFDLGGPGGRGPGELLDHIAKVAHVLGGNQCFSGTPFLRLAHSLDDDPA
jgi:hypothetical protein